MRFIYNLLVYLLLVPYALYWLGRAVINRSYRHKLGQRFGLGYPRLENSVWVHAVSVGEVVAAAPLVRALARRYPDSPIVVSTVTPTGAARVEALFGDRVHHCYIPFEMPPAVARLFNRIDPKIALVIETEIWPNLYRACGVRKIPLVLASARISPRSVRHYQRLLPLFRETLSHGIVIAAQSEADAQRFISLGASAERTRVTGNIKFDIELPDDLAARGTALRRDTFGERRIWIAASTHDKEEEQVLAAHAALRRRYPDLLLILVPRHPDRFASVRDQLEKQSLAYVARTSGKACTPETSVFFGDTMGEVTLFYAASDVAFIGGSLVPIGGHNLLEPAALGLPVVSGPHMFNAQEIADIFVAQNACTQVRNAAELERAVDELLADPEAAAAQGRRARDLLEQNRGAVNRLLGLVEPLLG